MEHPILKKQFEIRVKVDTPIVVGQDGKAGRRQLIEITSGVLTGCEGGILKANAYRSEVLAGKFVDPSLYYFCTVPQFEIYDDRLERLSEKIYICKAERLPDTVILGYFSVE